MKKVVGVNFSDSKRIYYFLVGDFCINKGDGVIVLTERGLQFGVVVTSVLEVDETKLSSPLKDIVRIATSDDVLVNNSNVSDASDAVINAKRLVSELGLDMQILNAFFTFDRKQLIVSFLADERVDFRELARKLAAIYKTRIELRQIGIRDKAKVVGGYGQCGRTLCCGSFLNDLNSVSINMAKNQNLALNPQKINGLCGRLMCCLAYENDSYNEYKKGLPKVGSRVSVDGEDGKVISVDIFARTYRVETTDSKVIDVEVKE